MGKINKGDFINELRGKELTKAESEMIYDTFVETLKELLAEGNSVTIKEVGAFIVEDKPESKGRNPKTQEEIVIPAHKKLKFKVSEILKKKLKELEV